MKVASLSVFKLFVLLFEFVCVVKGTLQILLIRHQFVSLLHIFSHCFLIDNLLRFIAVLPFHRDLVFHLLTVVSVSCSHICVQHLAFLEDLRSFQHLLSVFLICRLLQFVGVLCLPLTRIHCSFFLRAFIHFNLMLNDSAPLIELSVLCDWVVAFALVWKVKDPLLLLIKRFLDTVRHLKRVHDHICASLHNYRFNS